MSRTSTRPPAAATASGFPSRSLRRSGVRGQAALLSLIVLAVLVALGWWLVSTRAAREKEAKTFVRDVARQLAVDLDRKVLDVRLGREAQVRYPPSFRDRLIEKLRAFGRPAEEIEVKGDVAFTSYFFQPSGLLRAVLTYPQTHVYLDMTISHPQMWWQIDSIVAIWEPVAGEGQQQAVPDAPP